MKIYKKGFIKLTVMIFMGLYALPALGWNQLPLLTESPRVSPAGQVQLDIGIKFLGHKNFPFSPFSESFSRNVLSVPTLGINVGLGKRVELQLTYEVLFIEEEEFIIREQLKSGDLAFFTKVELLKERKYVPGMGAKIGAKLPNASDTYRVGTDETDLAFLALFGKTFSSITVSSHLGLLILGNPFDNARQDDLLGYGIGCTVPWGQKYRYTVEVAGQAFGTSHNERASAVFRMDFNDDSALTWYLSGRVGLIENSEDWGIAGGVRWTFDGLVH